MDLIEKLYGKPVFVLYALFANVPGHKTWPRKIFIPMSVLFLFLATFFQALILVIKKFQYKAIVEYLPTTVATAGILIYIPYVIFATDEEFKNLLSIMATDLKQEVTKEENEIKQKYVRNIKMFTNAFMLIYATTLFGIPLSVFIPYFFDLLVPLNETRERRMLVNFELLFDQQKFFYQIYLFESSVIIMASIVVGVTENMAVIFVQHTCCTAALIGHRLETVTHVPDRNALEKSDLVELMTRRLHRYIGEHQRLLQGAALIANFYDFPLTMVLAGTFCALSVSLAQATDPELTNATIVCLSITQVCQLFILCHLGQCSIDSSKQISVDAYNSEWDVCTLNVRKLLQMIILRASKPYTMIVKGVFVLSLEKFMAVMQTTISVYVMLRQTMSN